MKSVLTPLHRRVMRALQIACVAAFAMTSLQPVRASNTPVPPVPVNLEVPAGNKLFLVGQAAGTQQYVCLFTGSSYAWTFFSPQATLFKNNKPIVTHFLSPNPQEGGTARATWQHTNDSSATWAAPITSSTDLKFVAPGAIPWLLLKVVGVQAGAAGGDKLTHTTFIQRLNTGGGIAPTTGCAEPADIGKKALVPYTADYFFYKAANDESVEDE